jgi:putative transposase
MSWFKPNIPQQVIEEAKCVYKIIANLAAQKKITRHSITSTAIQLQCHPRSVYRKLNIFYQDPTINAFLPRKYQLKQQQPKKRLNAETEEVIQVFLASNYLRRKEALPLSKLLKLINRTCRMKGMDKISISTLRRRVKEIPLRSLALAKKIKQPPGTFTFKPGKLLSDTPLEFVQIDHTLVDQLLDLNEYGLGIRRPWLTLMIDIATRGIHGYYVSFANPSGTSNAIAMMIGGSDKDYIIERAGLSLQPFIDQGICRPWFLTGRPATIGCDNAADFLKGIFPSGCDYLSIDIKARPLGKTHYGGHIERLIGTFMNDVHMLPGATFSDVRMREGYDAERHACMTLQEFETWLVLNILRYHIEPHSALGCSPYQRFQDIKHNTPGHLKNIDLLSVRRAFLKRQTGTIGTNGIRLHNRRYQCPELAPYIGQKILIGYQPNDLSRLYASLDYQFDNLEVPLASYENQCWHLEAWQSLQKQTKERYRDNRLTDLSEDLLAAQFEIADNAKRRKKAKPQKPVASKGTEETNLIRSVDLIPLARARGRHDS